MNILKLNIVLPGNINKSVLDLFYWKLKILLVRVMDMELLFAY